MAWNNEALTAKELERENYVRFEFGAKTTLEILTEFEVTDRDFGDGLRRIWLADVESGRGRQIWTITARKTIDELITMFPDGVVGQTVTVEKIKTTEGVRWKITKGGTSGANEVL